MKLTSIIRIFYLHFAFILFGFLYSNNVYCDTYPGSKKTVVESDSSKVIVRAPNAEEKKSILENSDYKYDRVGPQQKSLWDRFLQWLGELFKKLFGGKRGKIGFDIFRYSLIIASIVTIILLILKNNIRALFYGKSASASIDFQAFEEDIHTIDFDKLILEATSAKDFRKAVRLHFLKLLKELSDKNLIRWKIDKTNNDYSMELADSSYGNSFNELALLYDYIWYGDFPLDENHFKNAVSKFKDFKI